MAWDIRPVIIFFILVSSVQHIWYFTSRIDDAATRRDDRAAALDDMEGAYGLPAGYENAHDGGNAEPHVNAAHERGNAATTPRRVAVGKATNRSVLSEGNESPPPLGWRSMASTLLFGAPSHSGNVSVPASDTGVEGGIGPPSFDNWTLYLWDSTPLLLHQGLFDAPGCRRGGEPNGHGKRSAHLRYKVDSDGSFNPWDSPTSEPESYDGKDEREEKYVYPWDIIDKLPPHDTRYAFKTCALVSNSGSLLDAKFGREIDEHDAVFRMNNAPTAGFEKYVGSKTTFDLLNRPHAEDVSKISSPEDQGNVSAVLFEADNWHLYRNILERQLRHMPYPSTLVLSPPFLSLVNALWVRLAKRWPRYANSCDGIKKASMLGENSQRCQKMLRDCQNDVCKPSSGFFALLMASQMCNQIDMYGFESYRRPWSNKPSRYHYFDEEEGTTAVHSFILIMKVFEFLSHRYPIVIKTPSYDPEKERMLEIKEREGKKQKQQDKAASAEEAATAMLQQQLHLRQKEKWRVQQILPYKQDSLLKAYNLKHSGTLGGGADGAYHVNSILERVGKASMHAAQISKARAISKEEIARYSS